MRSRPSCAFCDRRGTSKQRPAGSSPCPNRIPFRIPTEVVALILRIREEPHYGAVRTSLYLQRHYKVCVSPTTILKISAVIKSATFCCSGDRPGRDLVGSHRAGGMEFPADEPSFDCLS